ncbi:MAG: DNA-3-methyladenine glycosylase 2 family protein [Acholeplasmataceae bacterium]|nr:DNA-3-methyladenine glycosylase 2 family protein [Acholeplasmataceae bacterium]
MPATPDWSLGDKYLLENAPELKPLIEKYAPCTMHPENEVRYFEILVRGLISQQLPPDVVNNICQKLSDHFGSITPEKIIKASDSELAAQGLVQQKVAYLKSFANMVLDNKVTLDKFQEMTDAQITKQLLDVKGLGQWTIEMFLLLALCRTDIVPTADHVFKKSLKNLLNLTDIPKRGEINKITEKWRPWRSLAVWYLWRYADEE